jgi:glycosyltransferase involved in cell wall biosynthesis
MRLLIFSPYFQPHVGGVEGYVRDLNAELLELGLVEEILVFAPRLPLEGAPYEQLARGYRVVRYPAFEPVPNFPCPAPWRLGFGGAARRALRVREHDVVVCHTRFFPSSLAALAFSRAARLPLIHVEHGSDYVHMGSRAQGRVARAYDMTAGRLVLRRAQAVIAISRAAASFVRELAGREAQVIYRGVDHARYDAVQPCRSLTQWADGRPVVTFVGRLIDGKGVADLVESFARLQHPQALLCVVGDGPRRVELQALCVARGLADRVRFTGYQLEDRALELIRASDIIVNPSYTEGLPTSVLEAALLERAILASDVGGTSEVVTNGRSATLVSAGDVEALRRGLDSLLGDPELRLRLGRMARNDAGERFDRRASAQAFVALARQLLEASGGSLG